MTSLMAQLRNPFLRNYSETSLLKRNYGVLQANNQTKNGQNLITQNYKYQKQNLASSRVSNPFSKQIPIKLNPFEDKKSFKDITTSQVRSASQSKVNFFTTANLNNFYKGLQDIGTKQLMKNQVQKQARQALKNFGPQSLRYQYKPLKKYSCQNQHQSKEASKFNNAIKSEYYGYGNQTKDQEFYFPIQKGTQKKQTANKAKLAETENVRNRRNSYCQDIPEDINQDFGTMRNLEKSIQSAQNPDGVKQLQSSHFRESNRLSIQNLRQSYQPYSSTSSGFGVSPQMYESGVNFRTKFGSPKGGPLNAHTFDEIRHSNFNEGPLSQSKDSIFSDQIQFNSKLYFKINL